MKTSFPGFTLSKAGLQKGVRDSSASRGKNYTCLYMPGTRWRAWPNKCWLNEWMMWCLKAIGKKMAILWGSGRKSQSHHSPREHGWLLTTGSHLAPILELENSTTRWVQGITLSSLGQSRYSVISTECMTTWIKNDILWKTHSSKSLKCHWFMGNIWTIFSWRWMEIIEQGLNKITLYLSIMLPN